MGGEVVVERAVGWHAKIVVGVGEAASTCALMVMMMIDLWVWREQDSRRDCMALYAGTMGYRNLMYGLPIVRYPIAQVPTT